jgi:hypothetical protein
MGLRKEADHLDAMIRKMATEQGDGKVDINPGELGDFSDLDETNITRDEAFSAGCSVCGDEEGLCGHADSEEDD